MVPDERPTPALSMRMTGRRTAMGLRSAGSQWSIVPLGRLVRAVEDGREGLPEVHEENEGDAIAGAEAAVGEFGVVDGDVLIGGGFVGGHFDGERD